MLLLDSVLAPIKANINLVVGVVIVSAVLATGAYVLTLRGEISSQNKKIAQLGGEAVILQANIDTLKDNIAKLEDVNKTNAETIANFKEERQKSEAAIQSLAKKDLVNGQKIKDLNAYIDVLSKDPSKDGALAPVLSETLKAIKERKDAK